MRKLSIIIAAMALAGCFASSKAPKPSQRDLARVEGKFSGYTLAQLNEGRELYKQHCGNCHGLKSPSSESEAEWKEIVPDMAKRANKNGVVINAPSEKLILKYLITMSGSVPASRH
ncbi:hypothetical protein GCM10023093_31620 [Nemorincola caseinilytica]|uniref:Cytochrome c domain-containing protein n=1 Tax=Nemorincola caseinilytica TaxID=2054315 RepID=A0ABP8NPR6_9BACT